MAKDGPASKRQTPISGGLQKQQQTPPNASPNSPDLKEPTGKRKRVPKSTAGKSVPKKPRIAGGKNAAPKAAPTARIDIPWPAYFKELEKVHRALNLVFTFCCTRKHLATTFQNLKSAVENNTKKVLTIEDIAQIKFLVPKSIQFAYVDEEMLQIHVMAASASVDSRRGKAAAEDVYENIGKQDVVKDLQQVLLFEFIDGDLKKAAPKKGGRTQGDDFKMPTFSMPQMTKLINKRNEKFAAAIGGFLSECAESGADAVESIKAQYHPHVPIQANSGPVDPAVASGLPLEIPKERKSIAEIIEEIKTSALYSDQIVPNGHRVFPPQEPIFGDLSFRLSQALVNALYTAHNIEKLYSHQADAINNLYDGHHVIVSTSTSSGKSLIYQIPVLHELERDSCTRAIFIFPTKALAQDQRRSLIEVLSYMKETLGDVRVETFDGDTSMEERKGIRDEASVIFTNPGECKYQNLGLFLFWQNLLEVGGRYAASEHFTA